MKKNLIKNMTAAIAALFIALLALPQTALAQSKEAYVVENGSTLTFYYDANKATHTTSAVCGRASRAMNRAAIAAVMFLSRFFFMIVFL